MDFGAKIQSLTKCLRQLPPFFLCRYSRVNEKSAGKMHFPSFRLGFYLLCSTIEEIEISKFYSYSLIFCSNELIRTRKVFGIGSRVGGRHNFTTFDITCRRYSIGTPFSSRVLNISNWCAQFVFICKIPKNSWSVDVFSF